MSMSIPASIAVSILAMEALASEGIDAVHAEDMSFIRLPDGRYRAYYAACDRNGKWCIASAVTI